MGCINSSMPFGERWFIKMNDPLISVIVPVYKVEQYLDRCVESIVNQTYSNLEIILIDDGSPDKCPAMCDAWKEKDKRIKVVHKKNGGLSDARNMGMEICNGELIGFVDSDDWIDQEMYQRLYDAIRLDDSDIAACNVAMVWGNRTLTQTLSKPVNCVLNCEEAMKALIEESYLKQPVWCKLYKAKLIRNILFPIGKYHEDAFWSYQALGAAKQVSVINYVGYYYWQRNGSIMHENYSLKRLDALIALEQRQDYLESNFPSLAIKGRCSLWFSCMYHGQKILQNLPMQERFTAIQYINNILRRHLFSSNALNKLGFKERFWIRTAKVSFGIACRIRNILKLGL